MRILSINSTEIVDRWAAIWHPAYVFGAIKKLKNMMTKAFCYIRLSGLGQVKGDGFARQRDTIYTYAKANKIQIAHDFRDDGVSGTKDAFDRPGLTDLFVAIKSNGVRTVLVENADRLARDLMVSEIILSEFRKIGVKVIAADSGTDLTVEDGEPTRKLIRQILAAISEFDKTRIVQKLRAARIRKRKAGERCEGRKPYGATVEEQLVIERMKELQRNGASLAMIANTLNAEGVATRTGGTTKWYAQAIHKILSRS